VAFSVARSQKLGPVTDDTPVAFDVVFANVGEGFDVTASRFVCRTNGTYVFSAHLLGQNNMDVYAWIMMNDKHKVGSITPHHMLAVHRCGQALNYSTPGPDYDPIWPDAAAVASRRLS